MKTSRTILGIFGLLSCVVAAARGDYEGDVKSVLKRRCYACHGALRQEADLRLDSVQLMKTGGDSGAVVLAAKPDESLLLERILATDETERMPPEGQPLSAKEIAAIRRWIAAGAIAPADDAPEPDPREHWAFQPPERSKLELQKPALGANQVDALLQRQRSLNDVRVVPPAQRDLLLRRVYLDVVGVPPSRNARQQFLEDSRPDAYERVVDALLSSPLHGERWGRHWMDIWRYTDWYGLGAQLRNSQKHIWHWRDWIVESLNEDRGYDQMLRLMVAADELQPTDRGALRATGFLARNYYLFNRDTWLDETIEHTSKAFLGLTMNCCKCHDHKYDPLSQRDFYAFRAIFEPHQVRLDPVPGVTNLEVDGLPRVFDAHPEAKTYLFIGGDAKNPDQSQAIPARVPAVLAGTEWNPQRVELPLEAHRPSLQAFVLEDRLQQAESAVAAAREELDSARRNDEQARQRGELPAELKYESLPLADDAAWADDFEQPRPQLWKIGPGDWKHQAGDLLQTTSGTPRRYLRSLQQHPPDFIAQLRFTTTGGDKWRSVGINFDVQDGFEKMVYMSAVQPGSKLQYSYGQSGKQQFPVPGRVERPVRLNEQYRLTIAVRGSLLNVAINGKHMLAYQMNVQRRSGVIELTAYDAQVTYHDFRLQALPAEVRLHAANSAAGVMSPAEAAAALQLATAKLQAATLRGPALKAAFAADRARQSADTAELQPRVAVAAVAARRHELAVAEMQLAAAQLASEQAASQAERTKAQTGLKNAQQKVEQARAAVATPGEKYDSLQVSLKALEGPAETDASRLMPYPAASTGRRSAFAKWLTARENPLPARVAVNHLWLRHFGQPLVDPPNDFGLRTKSPPQQALLDHLAVELMESGWSMKQLHRRLVTSQAYQLSTSIRDADEQTLVRDPTNAYYWRRLPTRMEAQVIRDSLLALADTLDLQLGGPTIKPQTKNATLRRSLYFTRSRDDHDAFLKMFDDADILRCYRRQQSIVPQQALAMANSELSLAMARRLAPRIAATVEHAAEAGDETFVREAFHWVLCRNPSDQELQTCQLALRQLRTAAPNGTPAERQMRAEANLVHALLNHNDFVTIR